MRFLLVVVVTSLILFETGAADDLIISGYLPDYRSYINVNNTAPHLTDLVLFSIEPSQSGSLEGQCCLGESHFQLAQKARAHRKHFHPVELKLWVSIGGAGRSSGFRNIASSKEKLQKFIQEILLLCKRESLSGVDIDWEGYGRGVEFEAYMKLLITTAASLHSEGLLLSVTTREVLPQNVLEAVDRIHFMAYDLIMPKGPKHHADYRLVTQIVDGWLEKGYPAEKILVGIPGYGRHKENPGLVRTFAELVDDGLDSSQHDEWKGFLFDSPRSIRKKIAYVKKLNLGGVFIWELGHDKQLGEAHGGWLLEAAAGVKETRDEL